MSNNNPFRNKTSANVQRNVENWGETKFKPKLFNEGKNKHFNSNTKKPFTRKYDNGRSNFHKSKEKSLFNEVARGAKPENSTPWNKYKDEIVYRQHEEANAAQQLNMDSEEAKANLKQREINYRKSLVQQKKNEPTKWEDFAEDNDEQIEDSRTQSVGSINKHKGNQSKKTKFKAKNRVDTQSDTKFKKNISRPDVKKDFISKDLLENFDSKKLTYEQNNKLRSVITKTTIVASQTSLQNVVNELKKKNKKLGK